MNEQKNMCHVIRAFTNGKTNGWIFGGLLDALPSIALTLHS